MTYEEWELVQDETATESGRGWRKELMDCQYTYTSRHVANTINNNYTTSITI